MRKFLSFFICILITALSIAQTRHALLIGIGQYPDGSGWTRIHGDSDIPLIQHKLLQSGFEGKNIHILVNSEATFNAIVAGLTDLAANAQEGDVVYIHFSGHGQQITDLNGDEDDGFDEAWIPYDAMKEYEQGVYEGEKHLIDDYLNQLFSEIRKSIGKSGRLIIVADACHSGSGSRGYNDEEEECLYHRGTNDKFKLPKGSVQPTYTPGPIDWLFISACKDYQINFEYRDSDGSYYGALSYVISKDESDLTKSKYESILLHWESDVKVHMKKHLKGKLTMPLQELEFEGRPSTYNDNLF